MIGVVDLRDFWAAMAGHLWLAGLVILVLAAIDRWGLRAAPARHTSLLWTLSLVALCVPASWVAGRLGVDRLLTIWSRDKVSAATESPESPLRAVLHPDFWDQAPAAFARWPWQVATAGWIAGALLLAWMVARRGRAAAVAVTTVEPVMGKRLAVAAARAGVVTDRVVLAAAPCVPHARGLLRPRVVVSANLVEALDSDELAAVLAHERAHLRRRDPARRLFYQAVLLIFWFFPLTWLVLRRLDRAAEQACDEAVLRAGFAPGLYARAIARTVRLGVGWEPAPALALVRGRGADIQTRLDAIRRAGKETSMSRNRVAVALGVMVMVAAVATAAPQQGTVQLREKGARGATPQEGVSVLRRTPEPPGQFERLLGLRGVGREIDVDRSDTLRDALLFLARSGGFRVRFEGVETAADGGPTEWKLRDTTVGEALVHLARLHGLSYEVVSRRELVVRRAEVPVRLKELEKVPAGGTIRRLDRTDADAGGPVPVGGEIGAPERVHHVAPVYPELARQAKLEGVVILEATVDEQGNVTNVDVLRGLGLGLDEAARIAVRQWKYTPTVYEGRAVESLLTVAVQFQIDDE